MKVKNVKFNYIIMGKQPNRVGGKKREKKNIWKSIDRMNETNLTIIFDQD